MEFPLIADKVSCERKAHSFDITREESVEVIVPDALPDIAEILCVHADAFVRGKEADTGRGSVSGVVRAEFVYAPADGNRPGRLEAELPFSVSAADGALVQDMKIVARVCAVACSARELGPRKAEVTASVRVQAAFYADGELSVCSGLSDAGVGGVELLYETAEICLPADIRERTFVISGELTLPRDCPPAGELLFTDIALRVNDARAVGSKLVFKGVADVAPFYISDSGKLSRAALDMEFSQIVEFDEAPAESEFNVSLMLSGAYVETQPQEGDGRVLSVELHAVAQCVELERRNVKYIADAFAPGVELECGYAGLETGEYGCARTAECTARGTLHVPEAAGVIATFARAGAPETAIEDGQARIRCGVEVTCLYADADGQARSARTRVDAECVPFDARDAQGVCVPSVLIGETAASLAAGGAVEFTVPVTFEVLGGQSRSLRAITAISYDRDSVSGEAVLPSLTVTRARPREKLWTLAKRYGSGVRLIMDANGLERESDMAPGALLLIPRRKLETR
jgi:hypothetical protein